MRITRLRSHSKAEFRRATHDDANVCRAHRVNYDPTRLSSRRIRSLEKSDISSNNLIDDESSVDWLTDVVCDWSVNLGISFRWCVCAVCFSNASIAYLASIFIWLFSPRRRRYLHDLWTENADHVLVYRNSRREKVFDVLFRISFIRTRTSPSSSPMHRFQCLFVVGILCWPAKSFVLNSTDYIHRLRCERNLHVQINAIEYRFHQYNCTWLYAAPSKFFAECANQSSCRVDLKPYLYFRTRQHSVGCRRIKLKDVLLNYSCINETWKSSSAILPSSLHQHSSVIYVIVFFLCTIITMAFFAVFWSKLHYLPRLEASLPISDTAYRLSEQTRMPSNRADDYELKHLTVLQPSSSSSSFTSLNSQTVLTNPSEYDNLVRMASPTLFKVLENDRLPWFDFLRRRLHETEDWFVIRGEHLLLAMIDREKEWTYC